MTWTNDRRLAVLEYHPISAGATAKIVSGMTTGRLSANPDVRAEVAGGAIVPEVASLDAVAPVATFTTLQLKQIIDAIGFASSGYCIDSDGTHPGVSIFLGKQGCAGLDSGSVHDKYTIPRGIIYPRNLQVSHRGNATMSYEMRSRVNTSSETPVVRTPNVALPVFTANAARWTMYSLVFNSVTYEGKRDISIDFNPTANGFSADGSTFDSAASVANFKPQITMRGIDPNWFTTANQSGISGAHANSKIVLQKRNTPLTTAEHIQISISGFLVWDTIFDANPDGPAEISAVIHTTYNGITWPIVFDTAFAIV